MPELSDEGAEIIYRNDCVDLYFKTWIYLVKKIIYVDEFRILSDCPWEPTYITEGMNENVEVFPKIQLMENRFLWPCFIHDRNLCEVFFQLKFLWNEHSNNKYIEIDFNN